MKARKTAKLVLMVVVLGLLSLLLAVPVWAVHKTTLFELDVRAGVDGDQEKKNDPIPPLVGDGNTADDPLVPGDDWATIYNDYKDGTPAGDNSGAFAIAWVEDTFANNPIVNGAEPFVSARTPEVTFFTGGGSKDTNGIQDGPWLYKTVSDQVPDKNDIVNAFAAAYDDGGETYFYFGLDTFSVNGDANAGFWFFRNPVGLNPLAPGATTGSFSGEHSDGDIFVAVAYTQGGKIGEIDVYEWVGNDATGSLVQLDSGQDCATSDDDDDVCGVINKLLPGQVFGEDPVFDYANTLVANNPLSATSYQYQSAAFVEFGLDVEAILGGPIGCYTTFLAETRSSQSETAQLKDFAFGAFPICGIAVDKTGPALSKVGDEASYTITVTNTGKAALYKQSIVDSVFGDLTDGNNQWIDTSSCGETLAADASCTITVDYTVPEGAPDPLDNTVTIVYTEFADPASLTFTASDDHSVNLFQPAIAVAKTGDALSKVGDDVNYTITLSNNSSDDTPDLECTATDSLLGEVFNGVLPLGDTVIERTRTVLETDPDPLVNEVTLHCDVAGFPNEYEETASHSTNLFQPAIAVAKTGDALSKVGDDVNYTITLSNNSSADTPDMVCTAVDTLLGTIFDGVLPAGDTIIERTRTVLDTDPDPLVNTVTLTCSPDGFPNILEESDDHSTNLFQPAIAVAKTGDSLSKVGDDVNYTITLSNNSSGDTPAMVCVANDTLLGQVFSGVLPLGDTVLNLSREVLAGDPDPLVNTVTLTCSPAGFPNVLTESASHSTNLFQPAIAVAKTGDALSKVGDDVNYTITLSNNSSTDTPAMFCTAIDTLLGTLFSGDLPLGDTVLTPVYTVQPGDPDPLNNTVYLTCSPDGFPNVLEASASHSVNLFQPAIAVAKTGDTLSKVGDDVNYTITLSNNSSADTPPMNCTAEDTLLGTLFDDVLPLGNTVITPVYTVQPGDPDPLGNTVTLTCSPEGFPNVLEASASHSVNLFQPAIAVAKTGDALSKVGDEVNYTITLSNNSSADTPALNCTASDSLLGPIFSGVLPSGDTVFDLSRTVQAGDPDPLVNTVTLTCSPEGFPNVLEEEASHSTNLFQPAIAVAKTGDTLSKVGDPVDYVITLSNISSADTPALNCTAVDTLFGTIFDGVLPLGNTVINRTRTVQVGDPDPLINEVILHCGVAGFPNEYEETASHSTNLFQPGVEVIKTGPDTATRGETITYNFTINNLSSGDSPNLILDSVTDTVLGNLTTAAAAAGCNPLASGGTCSFTFDYTIQTTDPSPLVNVVTVHYHPANFPNDITDDDDHIVLIPIQGCTPGFWQGGAGAPLWNEVNDPQWVYGGTNPYIHTTLFNVFFNVTTDPRLDMLTMYELVASGGTSDSARRAARDMVAAYLNESAFPVDFPADSLADLLNQWYAAVAGGDAALDAFHVLVAAWNAPEPPGYCPLP